MVKKNETVEKIEIIKKVARTTKDTELFTKLLSIRLVFEGYSVADAARIADRCEKTVYNALNQYEASGIIGLYAKPKPGRIKKLTTEQETELYDTIKNKLPSEVGFPPFKNWTSSLAVQWIKKRFDVEFSGRGVRNIFERLGLSYTRPTYTLKKADPQKQEIFKETFEQIKKN